MIKLFSLYSLFTFYALTGILLNTAKAQSNNCTFKNPVITIHFGTGNVRDVNVSPMPNYTRTSSSCPFDGEYTFTSATSECFHGDWHTISEDHTTGDKSGNMMLVNAYPGSGPFLNMALSGLKPGATYEIAAWLMNVCRPDGGCSPLPPDITIKLTTLSGRNITTFHTGLLPQIPTPRWTQYKGQFTMPAGESKLVLTMIDVTVGGCGNDFALDDITFRECIISNPPVTKVVPPIPKPVSKQTVKSQTIKKVLSKKIEPSTKPPLNIIKKDSLIQTSSLNKQRPTITAFPPSIINSRANPLVRQIITEEGDIRIDLYDNGEIDGDTVSVYHNNELVVSRAMLTQKPITVHIKVDKSQPHHELVMVAHNLGSIPPNTALMIVTANDKRYEVFISTNEQKNAKVVIDLKE